MATLAGSLEVAGPVVARVLLEVRRGQEDPGGPDPAVVHDVGPLGRLTVSIAPGVDRRIEPAAVRQAVHGPSLRLAAGPAAGDTVRPRCGEPDAGADLRPVQRTGPAVRAERHGRRIGG